MISFAYHFSHLNLPLTIRTGGAPSPATEHEYAYDPIGNRTSSSDLGTTRTYTANNLNQYTGISDGVDTFVPQFDDDGDQTLIQTKTGIWSVTYNGEIKRAQSPSRRRRVTAILRPLRRSGARSGIPRRSGNYYRPVSWSCGETNVIMSFDRMGRRVQYTETVGNVTNAHHTFVYDGYLQIADNSGNRYLWDPSEPVATRPLVWLHGDSSYYYTHDGNKNVSEVVDANGAVTAHYEYAPFGDVTAAVGNLASANRFRFSSEYADDSLGLVYYNYRHYEPVTGRWMGRDLVSVEQASRFSDNSPNCFMDLLGAMPLAISGAAAMHDQIVHGKNDNGTFDGIAKAASRNNWVAVKSGRDIITHLKQLSQDDCCVDHYTIAGHGWRTTTKDDPKRIYENALPGAFGGDSDNNNQGIYKDNTVISDDELNRENGGVYLSDLEAEISAGNILFCPSCQIQIYACRIGSGFTIELSRITGCSVVAASGSCSIDDGKWKSGPGGFHERQLNEFFGFYRVKYLREGMDPKIDWIGNTYVPF